MNPDLYPSIPIVIIAIVINVIFLNSQIRIRKWQILFMPTLILFIMLGGMGYYLLQTLGGDHGWSGILLIGVSIFSSLWLLLFNNFAYKYKKELIIWNLLISIIAVIGSLVLGFLSFILTTGIMEAIN